VKKKLLYIAEPPTVNTGFGVVSQQIVPALATEFDIHALCTGGYGQKCLEGLADYGVQRATWTEPSNMHGIPQLNNEVLKKFEPDVIFTYYDVGSVMEYLRSSFISYWPHASYLITEGAPMMRSWLRMFVDDAFRNKQTRNKLEIDEIILPSEYSNAVAFEKTGRLSPVAYHGVNHANWQMFNKEDRKKLKADLAAQCNQEWGDNTFVIMYNARNAGRKQWPRFFRAIKLAQDMLPEITFKILAHTKVYNDYKLEGWALNDEVYQAGLDENNVIFSQPNDESPLDFVTLPSDKKGSLCKLYNCADLYFHPSAVEGAGIPLMEAARCGLPVLTTQYAAGWEYAKDYATPIRVSDYYHHSSGVEHALIDIVDAANKIVDIAKNKSLWHQMSARSLKNCNFTWDKLKEESVKAAINAIKKCQ